MESKYRTIRHDHDYEDQARRLGLSHKRLDEVLDGVTWAIARSPAEFELMLDTGLRLVKTDPFPDAPPLRIYFTWDEDDNCTLRWIEAADDLPEEQDYSG